MHCILNFRKGAFFIAIATLLFTACHPAANTGLTNDDDNGGYASDASRIELVSDDAISIADAAGTLYNGGAMRTTSTTSMFGTCATVGTDTIDNPHQLTIRFGDQDCVCLDGRTRRGTIIVYYSGEYTDTAQIHYISFSNYYVNDNQLTGNINTLRVDTTVTGNWYYDVNVNDTLIMSTNSLQAQDIIWTGTLERKWLTGYETPADRTDDAFSISGSATLTRANGHQFRFDITAPLQMALNCDYCEAGVVDITGVTGARILNYGSGTCDPNAQISIYPHVYNILLTP
jgi:hypothetical protein